MAICNELLSSESLIDDTEALVQKNWDKIEDRIRSESRSIKQILGESTTERLLKSVKNLDVYDSEAVNSFLESDAINSLFAKVLCKCFVEVVLERLFDVCLFSHCFDSSSFYIS